MIAPDGSDVSSSTPGFWGKTNADEQCIWIAPNLGIPEAGIARPRGRRKARITIAATPGRFGEEARSS
jgi:hypothetical protein